MPCAVEKGCTACNGEVGSGEFWVATLECVGDGKEGEGEGGMEVGTSSRVSSGHAWDKCRFSRDSIKVAAERLPFFKSTRGLRAAEPLLSDFRST